MTTAPKHLAPVASCVPTRGVDDVTGLLPAREALLDQLAERLPSSTTHAVTLLVLGLPRRADGGPVAQAVLAQVTSLLARSLRGRDWLGSSGPAEFAVLLTASETAAKTVAERLVRAVAALEVPGLSATAGVASLSPELRAGEVFRRATLSLTSARQVGAGTVIRYRDPLA
jgi:GGDEF domain-containing protein